MDGWVQKSDDRFKGYGQNEFLFCSSSGQVQRVTPWVFFCSNKAVPDGSAVWLYCLLGPTIWFSFISALYYRRELWFMFGFWGFTYNSYIVSSIAIILSGLYEIYSTTPIKLKGYFLGHIWGIEKRYNLSFNCNNIQHGEFPIPCELKTT